MTASRDTVEIIYQVVKRHVSEQQLDAILEDLAEVPGNQSFRNTIRRLLDLHERRSK
jgi:hypothetical protein